MRSGRLSYAPVTPRNHRLIHLHLFIRRDSSDRLTVVSSTYQLADELIGDRFTPSLFVWLKSYYLSFVTTQTDASVVLCRFPLSRISPRQLLRVFYYHCCYWFFGNTEVFMRSRISRTHFLQKSFDRCRKTRHPLRLGRLSEVLI